MNIAQWTNVGASGLIVVCAGVFIVVYHRHAPWRSSAVGWLLMMFAATTAGFGLYTVLITIWPDGPTAAVLRVCRTALMLLVSVLMLWQARLVLREQRRGRDGKEHADREG